MGGESDNSGGSHPWPWSKKGDDWTPWPVSHSTGVGELIGKKCRVVREGDHVTGDIEPGRVTILINQHGRIVEIYEDPALPTK